MAEDFHADRNVTEGKGNEARGSLKWISKCIRCFFLFTAVSAELLWETCLRGWEDLLTISVWGDKTGLFYWASRLATTFLLRSCLYHEMIWFSNRAIMKWSDLSIALLTFFPEKILTAWHQKRQQLIPCWLGLTVFSVRVRTVLSAK